MVKVECANCGTVYRLTDNATTQKSFFEILKDIVSFFDSLYFWINVGQRLINYLLTIL